MLFASQTLGKPWVISVITRNYPLKSRLSFLAITQVQNPKFSHGNCLRHISKLPLNIKTAENLSSPVIANSKYYLIPSQLVAIRNICDY